MRLNLICFLLANRHKGTLPQDNPALSLQTLDRVGDPSQQQVGSNNQPASPWDSDWIERPPQNTPLWGPSQSNQWNGRPSGNPHFPTNGHYYNPPQFQQPITGPIRAQNTWKGCAVIGGNSSVGGQQQNGHLGLSKAEEDQHHYENCTVGPGGKQLNGSANGKDGLAIASIFWGGLKESESRNTFRGEMDKAFRWRSKKSNEGRNF
jgi:hypothetical protein